MEQQIKKIKKAIEKLQDRIRGQAQSTKKVASVCNTINNSWSGSDLVGHANLFYEDFQVPPSNNRFSIEWGLINGVPDGWHEKSTAEITQHIKDISGVSPEDLDKEADFISEEFEKLRKQTIIAFSGQSKDQATKIEEFSLQTKADIFNQYWRRQITTRDSGALFAGRIIPTHKYYEAAAAFLAGARKQLDDFLYLIDRVSAEDKSLEQKEQMTKHKGRTVYIDRNTLIRLTRTEHKDFDLSRLISLCNELDDNYSLENYYSCAMLLRAILDHIPPIFGKKDFSDVCSQHGGKSFKDIMKPLNETAKKIGDDYLHTQVGKKVLAVTRTQVSFQANLDMLLNEVAAILEGRAGSK